MRAFHIDLKAILWEDKTYKISRELVSSLDHVCFMMLYHKSWETMKEIIYHDRFTVSYYVGCREVGLTTLLFVPV